MINYVQTRLLLMRQPLRHTVTDGYIHEMKTFPMLCRGLLKYGGIRNTFFRFQIVQLAPENN